MKNRRQPLAIRAVQTLAAAFLLSACGAGPFGFSRYYVPTKEEVVYEKQATEYNYGEISTKPEEYKDRMIAWFGIVEKVTPTDDERFMVRLSQQQHKERHLCSGDGSSSCRVTVHFKSHGSFSVLIALKEEDLIPGIDRIQPGTLMRVFGKLKCRKNQNGQTSCDRDDRGTVMLNGVYYRQWPRRYYVTTRAAADMRR